MTIEIVETSINKSINKTISYCFTILFLIQLKLRLIKRIGFIIINLEKKNKMKYKYSFCLESSKN